jgi:DNA modification methylase
MINTIILADVMDGLKSIPDKHVQVCVTSPPYYALRDYGVEGQIGLEDSPEEFILKLVSVFSEVKRVLKDDGTLWVNIGDSYAGSGKGAWDNKDGGQKEVYIPNSDSPQTKIKKVPTGCKPKDLIGIPWMLAFALRADGWYLRQDIIWSKPNPMPESVLDRCTKSHEYIFMLSKSKSYHYDGDAIRTPIKESSISRLSQNIENQSGSDRVPGKKNGNMKAVGKLDKQRGHPRKHAGFNDRWDSMSTQEQSANGANKRSVWTVATMPYKEAHFATFPEKLIVDCIKAGCLEGGIVLDPFIGAGTTALVSRKLFRNYIGIEINPLYKQIADDRIKNELGLFV